jgi:prevent-host-death family protein
MEILAEDIRPIAELKTKTGRLLRHVQSTRRPLLLTQKGKPTAVLLGVKEFVS